MNKIDAALEALLMVGALAISALLIVAIFRHDHQMIVEHAVILILVLMVAPGLRSERDK